MSFHFDLQVARPITLKKDGIQTRNRKLAAKAKKAAARKMDMSSMAGSVTTAADLFRWSSSYGTNPAAAGYNHYYGNHSNFGQMNSAQFNPYNHLTNFGASAFFGAGSTAAAIAEP